MAALHNINHLEQHNKLINLIDHKYKNIVRYGSTA